MIGTNGLFDVVNLQPIGNVASVSPDTSLAAFLASIVGTFQSHFDGVIPPKRRYHMPEILDVAFMRTIFASTLW